MLGEKSEFIIDGENILGEEVHSSEALELERVVKVEPALFLSVLSVGAVEIGAVEEASLYDLAGIDGLLVEPVVHSVGKIAKLRV